MDNTNYILNDIILTYLQSNKRLLLIKRVIQNRLYQNVIQ